MKAQTRSVLVGVVLLVAVALVGWHAARSYTAPRATEARVPVDFTQLTVATSPPVQRPAGSGVLGKPSGWLDAARQARALPRPEAQVLGTRDAVGDQVRTGLRRLLAARATTSQPLSGRPRGTGTTVTSPSQQRAVEDLRARLGDTGGLEMDSVDGTLRQVRGDLAAVVSGDPTFARVRQRGDFAGMALALVGVLGPAVGIGDAAVEFAARPPERDELGMTHVRLDQQHAGLPVLGAQIVVHFAADGTPVEVNGVHAPSLAGLDPPVFGVGEAEAIRAAREAVGAVGEDRKTATARAVMYWNPSVTPVAAWAVDVVPTLAQAWEVIVAAEDGRVLRRHSRLYRAAAQGQANDLLGVSRPVPCWQEGGEFLAIDTTLPMFDATRSRPPVFTNILGGICLFDVRNQDLEVALKDGIGYFRTADRNQWDPTMVSGLSHFRRIDAYYRTTHGRNSFDGKGITVTALLHARFKNPQGTLYSDNAFFNPSMNVFVFGDGEVSTIPGRLPAALDIAAHEYSHGVVDNTAAFRYENQSGALHEHVADLFACMIDREDWILGEDTVDPQKSAGGRDLSDPANPRVDSPGPKSMAQYQNLPNTPEGDNGGVHVNSTIPSHAMYLATAGSSGLGREKMEKIAYRAIGQYLTQYASFVDYRRAQISAAKDLFPNGTEADVIAGAFDAVGIVDGQATPTPTPVPATAGEERAVFLRAEYDAFFGFFLGYGFYLLEPQDTVLITQNALARTRPAVSGDGQWALFVDDSGDVHWTDGMTEEQLTDTGGVRSVALSKDQRYVAFTTDDYDNRIHLLGLTEDTIRTGVIQVPTSGEAVVADFADVLAFDCTGEFLYFDAFAEGMLGQAQYGCWGLFVMRVKDLQCQSLLPMSPGFQVGNPSLAHTFQDRLTADYEYQTNGITTIGMVALDLGRNALHVLSKGLAVYASPSFRGDDRALVFTSQRGNLYYLEEAALSPDGSAIVDGSVNALLWSQTELVYPVGFRSGTYTAPAGHLQVTPATVNFGSSGVGAAVGRNLELQNTGDADLELIEVVIEGADVAAYDFASALDKRIAVGQRQALALSFTPTRTGAAAATLRFRTTVPGSADITVALAGTGTESTRDYWREVWQDFQDRYAYFEHKGVDWNQVYEANRQAFQGLNPTQFGQKLNDVLQVLHDWHVAVGLPDGTYVGYRGEYPWNFATQFFRHYAGGQVYGNVNNANVLYHNRLTGNWAHLVVTTLSTEEFAKISDADLDAVLAGYADANGWILDLRPNSGGNEANAAKVAARLTAQPVLFGHVRYRTVGSVPYAFGDWLPKTLQPSAAPQYTKPVVGLIGQRCMSSAEWFTLMLRACPNTVLVGDRTRGASGNPTWREIPELKIEYGISSWMAYDENRQPFEDRGISPAIAVPPGASIDAANERDFVLEKAIAYLQWRQSLGSRLPLVSARSDADQDGQLDVAEFVAGTDPLSPGPVTFGFEPGGIRVLPQGGLELRWRSTSGRHYHLERAESITGPWTRIASDIAATPPVTVRVEAGPDPGVGQRFFRLVEVP